MNHLTTHERPGVYSGYDMVGVLQNGGSGKIVAIAAACAVGEGGKVCPLHKTGEAATSFPTSAALVAMAELALQNGASAVYGYGVEAGDYAAAYAALLAAESIGVLVSDLGDKTGLQALRDAATTASADRRECIAVAAVSGTISAQVKLAEGVNSERVVLVGSSATAEDAPFLAAAVAGAIAGMGDPSLPLGGAELSGQLPACGVFSETELDALVRGGLTPVEQRRGVWEVVRGITTRTKSGAVSDTTWRELSTILIVDDVIPTLRQSLRALFHRAKNTDQTRGAIRSQVILELESKKNREIITEYDGVTVSALEDSPTVCVVEFTFAVAHGLSQIWVSAHITV